MDTGESFLYSLFFLYAHPRRKQANGPLNAENVFEYFATSMFYDKQSNNQVLRMQTMHTGVPIKDEAAELRYASFMRYLALSSANRLQAIHWRRICCCSCATSDIFCDPKA